MMKEKQDTSSDDPYRRLVEKSAEKESLRRVLRDAGILDTEEVKISHWLNGRNDRRGRPYYSPLNGETRDKLFAHLKAVYPKEVAEIEAAPIKALLEKASKIATRVPNPTELDRFAEYVENEAIITIVTADSVTAEGADSTRTYNSPGGLTEEVYVRLAYDDLSREALAWGVIENLLRMKSLSAGQIRHARRLLPDILELVDQYEFEVVADELSEAILAD
jgi:hypothetical protein